MGGHGRRGTCAASWTWNPHAREIVLAITQKVQTVAVMSWMLLNSLHSQHLYFLNSTTFCYPLTWVWQAFNPEVWESQSILMSLNSFFFFFFIQTRVPIRVYDRVAHCWRGERDEWFVSMFLDRTIAESKKKHEEKQLKAQQLRDKLREEKTLKLQKLLERVSEPCRADRTRHTETPCNWSPVWLILRGFVSTLPDRITKYYNPLQSHPGQLAADSRERDPRPKSTAFHEVCFCSPDPREMSES